MPFDIICLFPGLPSVMKVWPQYSECCWRETSFSSCISHHWSSWALTILSPRGMGCHPAARWFNPVPCCPGGRGTALGKFLFPSPLLSNSYFFTLMVTLGKCGFLQILSSVCIRSGQHSPGFPPNCGENLGWFHWLCSPYQGLSAY